MSQRVLNREPEYAGVGALDVHRVLRYVISKCTKDSFVVGGGTCSTLVARIGNT